MSTQELIERIMTEHWDFLSCSCAFCHEASIQGFGPRSTYPRIPGVSILDTIDNGVGYAGTVMKQGQPQ